MPQKQPNILFIMADDIGWFNSSCYHQGVMGSRRQGRGIEDAEALSEMGKGAAANPKCPREAAALALR